MRVGGANYYYNGPLVIRDNSFDIYRTTFLEYGLGEKTNIDLPVESYGYKGTSTNPGHLLDIAIGQYDTYTPIQLSQYINTLANGGNRYQPYLLKEVYAPSGDGAKPKPSARDGNIITSDSSNLFFSSP